MDLHECQLFQKTEEALEQRARYEPVRLGEYQ